MAFSGCLKRNEIAIRPGLADAVSSAFLAEGH
jgi:hypothetical protein